jgi:hypothetical protein
MIVWPSGWGSVCVTLINQNEESGVMGNEYAAGIYVVAATKDGAIQYWAAATPRRAAEKLIEQLLAPGWMVAPTDRRLSTDQLAALNLRPGGARQLEAELRDPPNRESPAQVGPWRGF